MSNENKKTINENELKVIDGNALANTLYNIARYKKGKAKTLSKTDFQAVYFYTEKARESYLKYANALKQLATADKLKAIKDDIYLNIGKLLKMLDKVNGFSVLSKRAESSTDTEIFIKGLKVLFKDKAVDHTAEMSQARQELSESKKALKELKAESKKTAEIEKAEKLVKEKAKAVATLEKTADNCTTCEIYATEKQFAKAFIFELARLVKNQADKQPQELANERKQRNAESKAKAKQGRAKASESKQAESESENK